LAGFVALVSAVRPLHSAEALLVSSAATGGLVALAQPLPPPLVHALAFAVGATLAFDSSPGGISVREANAAVAGTFFGALLLLLAMLGLVRKVRREWLRVGVRILGSWIAASAILVLSLRLAR
jgi:hypothetical protein